MSEKKRDHERAKRVKFLPIKKNAIIVIQIAYKYHRIQNIQKMQQHTQQTSLKADYERVKWEKFLLIKKLTIAVKKNEQTPLDSA